MLHLDRKPGETVEVKAPDGSVLIITYTERTGNSVVLSFESKVNFEVWRGEIAEAKRAKARAM